MAVESSRRIEGLSFEIDVASGHQIRADEQEALGGTNTGPSPHDLLEAALAGCTVITVQMYANRKGIPLKSTNVKIHIIKEGSENKMVREIEFIGELSEEQKKRLFEIAERCPIHNFLSRGAQIESKLLEPRSV
jgi:putative redox protein